jgi:hypothetical protein
MFGGTFTRANRRTCVDGSRATTARFSDSRRCRERMRRIHRQRRANREDALLERLAEMDTVVAAQVLPVDDADAGGRQSRPDALARSDAAAS